MPAERAAGSGQPKGFVPVPNALFDDLLPGLKDTELRVLLVVARKTAGFSDGAGGRKARDWIGNRMLCRATGRESAAVSRAVDSLARRGLIAVETHAGRPLATPNERRRYLGRLYYRLAGPAAPAGMGKTAP